MTPRQRTAIEHPCGRAPETIHHRFWLDEKSPIRHHLIRSGLTINR